jgi:uncharacterized protein VirK/YbjX
VMAQMKPAAASAQNTPSHRRHHHNTFLARLLLLFTTLFSVCELICKPHKLNWLLNQQHRSRAVLFVYFY